MAGELAGNIHQARIGKGLAQSDGGFGARIQLRDGAQADGLSAGGPGEGNGGAFERACILDSGGQSDRLADGGDGAGGGHFFDGEIGDGAGIAAGQDGAENDLGTGRVGRGQKGRPIRRRPRARQPYRPGRR